MSFEQWLEAQPFSQRYIVIYGRKRWLKHVLPVMREIFLGRVICCDIT